MYEIDPATTASQLASAYTHAPQEQIDASRSAAQRTATGLSSLKAALSAFDGALSSLSSVTGSAGMRKFTASLSAGGTASASSTAASGSYSFQVEQLASSHQIVFEDLPAVPVASGGPLNVQLGDGSIFSVDLLAADSDGDGSLSQSEIARAINQAEGNQGKVTASVVTVGDRVQLLLSAAATGSDSQITLDTSAVPAGALRDALDAGRELTAARDAIVWLGGAGGVRLQQASNTFTALQGVTVTFTEASATPVTLTVAADAAGTAAQVQKFIDAYNALKAELDALTKVSTDGSARSGAFATDAGIRTLRSRLDSVVRQEFGGLTLAALGVKANREGRLALDQARLDQALAARPSALDGLFGKATLSERTGLLGSLDEYVEAWLQAGTGLIASRQSSIENIQKRLTERQARLDLQYENMYQRYLQQFTQLQSLQSQMGQTSGLFATIGTS